MQWEKTSLDEWVAAVNGEYNVQKKRKEKTFVAECLCL